MKYFFSFLSIQFGLLTCTCAQDLFNFHPSNPNELNEIMNFEKSLGSINTGIYHFNAFYDANFSDFVIKAGTNPMIFRRTNDDFFPTLHTWYYFKDSIVHGFAYNWGFYNTGFNVNENIQIAEAQISRKDEYSVKYEEIKNRTSEIYGLKPEESVVSSSMSYHIIRCVWDNPLMRSVLIYKLEATYKMPPGNFGGGDSRLTLTTFYK